MCGSVSRVIGSFRRGIADRAVRHWRRVLPTGAGLHGVSSLADGADQLFAAHVLAAGGTLEAVLPCAGYAGSLIADGSRARFEDLVRAAGDGDHHALPGAQRAGVPRRRSGPGRPLRPPVRRVGRPAGPGLGGTADVVAYARARGRPVTVLWIDGVHRAEPSIRGAGDLRWSGAARRPARSANDARGPGRRAAPGRGRPWPVVAAAARGDAVVGAGLLVPVADLLGPGPAPGRAGCGPRPRRPAARSTWPRSLSASASLARSPIRRCSTSAPAQVAGRLGEPALAGVDRGQVGQRVRLRGAVPGAAGPRRGSARGGRRPGRAGAGPVRQPGEQRQHVRLAEPVAERGVQVQRGCEPLAPPASWSPSRASTRPSRTSASACPASSPSCR